MEKIKAGGMSGQASGGMSAAAIMHRCAGVAQQQNNCG